MALNLRVPPHRLQNQFILFRVILKATQCPSIAEAEKNVVGIPLTVQRQSEIQFTE